MIQPFRLVLSYGAKMISISRILQASEKTGDHRLVVAIQQLFGCDHRQWISSRADISGKSDPLYDTLSLICLSSVSSPCSTEVGHQQFPYSLWQLKAIASSLFRNLIEHISQFEQRQNF